MGELKEIIEKAVQSGRLDAHFMHFYKDLIASNPDMDLTIEKISLMAEGKESDKEADYIRGSLGTIYVLEFPWVRLPELLADDFFIRFEGQHKMTRDL